MSMLTFDEFKTQVNANVLASMEDLYGNYVKAFDAQDPKVLFPTAEAPLNTPEFVPVPSVVSQDEVNTTIKELENTAGIEHLIVSIGGLALKMGFIAL